MSDQLETKHITRSRRSTKAAFRPNFTFSILYLLFFLFAYGILFTYPDLAEFLSTLPATMPLEEVIEKRNAYATELIGPRLIWMLGAALVTTALGIYSGFLPGVRPKR